MGFIGENAASGPRKALNSLLARVDSACMAAFIEVPCQVCGAQGGETVLQESFETLSAGRQTARLVFCGDCGFLYATPRPAPDTAFFERAPSTTMVADFARFIGRFAALESGPGDALDARAFDGSLMQSLDLPGWRKFGIEPSYRMATAARSKGMTITQETLEDNHLTPEAFDLVTCRGALETAFDVRTTMQELERLVRPSGSLCVCVPDSLKAAADSRNPLTHDHLSHFTAGTLQRLLRDFGFRTTDLESLPDGSLCARARKESRTMLWGLKTPDDREALRSLVSEYVGSRSWLCDELRRALSPRLAQWDKQGTRLAISGTRQDIRLVLGAVDLRHRVEALVDPLGVGGHEVLGFPYLAPERFEVGAFDTLLLAAEATPPQRLLAKRSEAQGIEVLHLPRVLAPAA